MRRNVLMGGVVLTLALVWAGGASAQEARSTRDVHLGDLHSMKTKFVGLAEAFSEDQYDWRPMEGVRSVREVLALMVAECYAFPPMWGADAARDRAGGFREQMEQASGFSREVLIAELGQAFDYAIAAVEQMTDDSMEENVQFFRSNVPRGTAIMMGTGDAHEHLGQLIAYARTNQIVPPWSRGGA